MSVLAAAFLACTLAAASPPEDTLGVSLSAWLPAAERDTVRTEILKRLKKAARGDARAFLLHHVEQNLADKAALSPPLPMSAPEILSTVVDYEVFKFSAYQSSGVFPKRYFGYFDLKWDTAPRERVMMDVVHRAVGVLNAFEVAQKSPLRFTDAEVAITFLAEGGAILLRERQDQLDNVHPVYGIGLDDIALGFERYQDVIRALDAAMETHLAEIVEHTTLRRNMTFKEAILGTALMYLYEKERAADMLAAKKRPPLPGRSLEDQFILTSLVYNSGILFDEERIKMIASFSTRDYLARMSRLNENTRGALSLATKGDVDTTYLEQPTAWNAVYHVLQRYGAYAAMRRFTHVFDDHGMFKPGAGAQL